MSNYTLKDVKRMGEPDEKWGQSYWIKVNETNMPVKFSSHKDFSVGDKITYEDSETKTSAKGNTYLLLKKVRKAGEGGSTYESRGNYQPKKSNDEGMAWGNALNVGVQALINNIPAKDLLEYAQEIFDGRPDNGKQEVTKPRPPENADVIVEDIDDEPVDLSGIPF